MTEARRGSAGRGSVFVAALTGGVEVATGRGGADDDGKGDADGVREANLEKGGVCGKDGFLLGIIGGQDEGGGAGYARVNVEEDAFSGGRLVGRSLVEWPVFRRIACRHV